MFSLFDFAVFVAVTGLSYLVLSVWTKPARPSLLQRNKDVELSIQNRDLGEHVQYGRGLEKESIELVRGTREVGHERPQGKEPEQQLAIVETEAGTDAPDTDVQPLVIPEVLTDDVPRELPQLPPIGKAA